jgi:hypothetical protein
MGREDFEVLKGGLIKRRTKRIVGVFIDSAGLDRATRRLDRKVDLSQLVRGLAGGVNIACGRYYVLIPNEDDARQFAYLDAVERAGLEVVTKRLPPKGVKRQVSMDVHMATDIISFAYGHLGKVEDGKPIELPKTEEGGEVTSNIIKAPIPKIDRETKRSIVVVCPSRELSYAMFVAHELGVETSLADFGLYGTSSGWKGIDRWIDLSTSETIWREKTAARA